MITFNMIIFAFPTWLIFGGIVLKAKNIPMFVYVLVFVVSLLIIIIRNTIGCKGQIGYIILYTLVQSFIGFVIGLFGIAAIGIGVFVLAVLSGVKSNEDRAYNIELSSDYGESVNSSNIRVMKDPNNSNRLIAPNGDVFERNSAGEFVLIQSTDSDRLFHQYTIK